MVAPYASAMLTVGLLGPVELRRDGERIALPGGKTTELLVRLALEAGRTVRSERLIDDLWGDEGVGTAKNTLQSKVSQLRKALGDPELVKGGAAGYSLALGSIGGGCDRGVPPRRADIHVARGRRERRSVAFEFCCAGDVPWRVTG